MLKLKPRKTVDDFMKLPEGTLAELIGGELFMTPSPRLDHQRIALRLAAELQEFLKPSKIGEVCIAPLDVHLPSGDIVQPDIIFVKTEHRAILQDWIKGAPDLLIEILSADRPERDKLVKKDLYARNGVSEYWIVDPEARAIEVLSLQGKAYAPAGYFQKSDALISTTLPGFVLRLSDLFPIL